MRFLSVAERELRAAARNKATYRGRWIVASAFFALLLWFGWIFDVFNNRAAAPRAFFAFSNCIYVYCLLIGATVTADCISRERRDGTLGLLFLTNLNSAEIVGGKLCASGLAALYGLLAIFPIMAIPLLMGGITFDEFWRIVLALVNGMFFALAMGMIASAFCVKQFPAVALAVGLTLFAGLGLFALSEASRHFGVPRYLTNFINLFCPLQTLLFSNNFRRMATQYGYWSSAAAVAATSWLALTVVAWRLRYSWRDRPKTSFRWRRAKPDASLPLPKPKSKAREALRKRFLDINPFFWLAGRQRISAPIMMTLIVALILITIGITGPFFARTIRAGVMSPIIGHLFAWFWAGLAIHAMVLYYCGAVASQRLAEDKQTGALELLLCTPASERQIFQGLWLAYGRKIFFPALFAALIHFFVVWQGATAFLLEPSERIPGNPTTLQFLWCAFFDLPFKGQPLEWHFGFVVRGFFFALLLLGLNWLSIGWVGRWLGLRMKHPGFAPMISIGLTVVPPVLGFSLFCFLMDKFRVTRMPERQFLPLMMWTAFLIGLGNCLVLSFWAAGNLRRHFRSVVASRFQPPPRRRFLPSLRSLVRFATAILILGCVLGLAIVFYYQYQNWRSRRDWVVLKQELAKKGDSLDLAPLLQTPVADDRNFARALAFRNLIAKTNVPLEAVQLLDRLRVFEIKDGDYGSIPLGTDWMKQKRVALGNYATWVSPNRLKSSGTRTNLALSLLEELKPEEPLLRDLSQSARLPYFQPATNRDALTVIHFPPNEAAMLERLNALFHIRACALLQLQRNAEAADDVLASIDLAGLARQIPDAKSSRRVHVMLERSLQPLWEGLLTHQWNDEQLAAFQKNLSEFNLLADYTNTIHRVTLASIEIWQQFPDQKVQRFSVPVAGNSFMREDRWAWQPRAWWFDACAQLYRAREIALENVDVAGGRVRGNYRWADLNGLPVGQETMGLFQQSYWWGTVQNLASFAQTSVNQAILACALERYRLAHNEYPENLEPLSPTLLTAIPKDIVRGLPLIYQPLTNGSYILRSVGPNGTDDSANSAPSDDWLWSYSTNAPVIQKNAR